MQNTNRTAQIITAARTAQGLPLRDFGRALGVTGTQAQNYETGKQEPDKARVAAWIESDTPWVQALGLAVFGAQFGGLIQAVLVPDAKRYALTDKAETVN